MSFESLMDEQSKARGNFTRPVTFTLAELWLLNDTVRHGIAQADAWKYPPVSKDLNQEIALSIIACVDGNINEYTLELCEGDMLVIDFNIRRDMKDAKGQAKGQEILLKVFRALSQLAMSEFKESKDGVDLSYKEVTQNANADTDSDDYTD